ncbi:hypothetical protein [Spirillospora albida]|uniref:hypothetical protein n=1 Tax=Spirillospora albida TaxID=58123 RepID=UPI0004C006EA|nr:hypothetical protein [Spirillospora albida]
MPIKRPSFLPSREALEQQALDRSTSKTRPGSQFDHPTAKYLFIVAFAVTVAAHVVGGVLFALIKF